VKDFRIARRPGAAWASGGYRSAKAAQLFVSWPSSCLAYNGRTVFCRCPNRGDLTVG
jgi:hypothetical protein